MPALGALTCFAQMAGLPLETWLRLVIWLVVGLAIYFSYGRANALRTRVARVRRASSVDDALEVEVH